jgi:mitogen-activated protein kinase kinase kinase
MRLNRASLQGSVFWMAPEVVKQTTYTKKADIWSVGCLVVEMLTGEHPWPNLTQMQAIFRVSPDPDPSTRKSMQKAKTFFWARPPDRFIGET